MGNHFPDVWQRLSVDLSTRF